MPRRQTDGPNLQPCPVSLALLSPGHEQRCLLHTATSIVQDAGKADFESKGEQMGNPLAKAKDQDSGLAQPYSGP